VELMLGRQIPVADLPIEEGWPIIAKADGSEISPDLLLVATGRRPNTEDLELAELGIATTPFIEVDAQLRTHRRNIFAIGDVNGLNMLDSGASSQARVAIDAITGGTTLFSLRWVPRYLDTDPPIAAVGPVMPFSENLSSRSPSRYRPVPVYHRRQGARAPAVCACQVEYGSKAGT
jgi:Pyridine nucleotide-disulphide oxidoreductase